MRRIKTAALACLAGFGLLAYGETCLAGNFSVSCAYSHTKPDDSIVYPGQPGRAMVHDFFGNTSTDAYSDYTTLTANKVTTCNDYADLSAYWIPQLRRAAGIVMPSSVKTYYKNDQPVVPVNPIPAGLQILAGDHKGTGPTPQINYLCRGGGYTTAAPITCPVVTDSKGSYAQFNISVHFPDCWDGKTLRPNARSGGALLHAMAYTGMMGYMAYRNPDGTCPSNYPVKIPELQLNVEYYLGQDPDLSTAQLSMDPILVDGVWVPQWGSLYTAHADFIDAWKVDSMKYAVEKCSNSNMDCANAIPVYYSPAIADAWINATGTVSTSDPKLQVGPGDVIFMKFPTPTDTTEYPWDTASLQTMGQNITNSTAITLDLYGASTKWNDTDTPPKTSDCTTQRIGGIYLNNVNQARTNDVTNYVKSAIASSAPMIGICIRNKTGATVTFSSKEGTFSPALFFK